MSSTNDTAKTTGTDLGQRLAGWAIVAMVVYLVIAQ